MVVALLLIALYGKVTLNFISILDISEEISNSFEKSNSLISEIGFKNRVKRHSNNIIDLIEVGDLILCSINTMRTELMQVKEYTDARKNEKYLGVDGSNIVNCKIYKIWTKEQLKTIEYNVI